MKKWLLCACLAGCFSTTQPEPGCPSPCRDVDGIVDRCQTGQRCYEETDCNGETVLCASPTCDEPLPDCPRGERVTSCEGFEECVEITHCDVTLYCAERMTTCDPVPTCNRNERLSDVPCGDATGCRAGQTCNGQDYFCYDLGDVCAAEPPLCPAGSMEVDFCSRDVGSGCTVLEGCSADRFCLADSCLRAAPMRRPPEPEGCADGTDPSTIPCSDEELRAGTCERVSGCGHPLYCRIGACEDIFPGPLCNFGEVGSSTPCAAGESCREVRGSCGERLYCRTVECPDGPVPAPVCVGEYSDWSEDPCRPGEDCRVVGDPVCGPLAYCRRPDCVSPAPTCNPDEEPSLVEPCRPGETCRELVGACGDRVYCREIPVCPTLPPCDDPTREMVGMTDPMTCETIASCHEEIIPACAGGGSVYCVMACPEGSRQVSGPLECHSAGDCFLYDPNPPLIDEILYDQYWCTGNGGSTCDAEPTCDEGDREIPWDAVCPPDGSCYYRSLCGASVQCQRAP